MTSTYAHTAHVISTLIRSVLIALVRLYQRVLSPLLGSHCRFEPTCSEYCIRVLRKHGVCKGLRLGAWRILRCNPFCRAGYDPVPDGPDDARGDDTTRSGTGS